MALARLGGSAAVIRTASMAATSADSGSARRVAASSSAVQKPGSRLMEVWWPAIVTDRLTGPTKPPSGDWITMAMPGHLPADARDVESAGLIAINDLTGNPSNRGRLIRHGERIARVMESETGKSEAGGSAGRARRVLERATERGWSIVTAESCTGGQLASLLTDIEGASGAFERGFVVYSEVAKCELLGLEQRRITQCGVVSRETAIAMAEGALTHSHGDVAIGITGFAGPAGPDDEPGLVHIACATRSGETRHRECHFGDIGRDPVRDRSVLIALEMLGAAME